MLIFIGHWVIKFQNQRTDQCTQLNEFCMEYCKKKQNKKQKTSLYEIMLYDDKNMNFLL